jgi:hypothetical protein
MKAFDLLVASGVSSLCSNMVVEWVFCEKVQF